MNIGNAIKQLRLKNEISQLELSQKCNISQAGLSKIESGLKRPGKDTLAAICAALNVNESLLYMFSIEEDDVPAKNKRIYKELMPEVKNLLLQIIEGDRKSSTSNG